MTLIEAGDTAPPMTCAPENDQVVVERTRRWISSFVIALGLCHKVRKQKLKEIRVRPKTGGHDIDTKVAHARKFLEHNDKVQVTVIFRGREMQHQEEGRRVLDAVLAGLAGVGKVERPPAMDGKRMTAMLMPIKAASKPRANPVATGAVAKPTS